jgi:hypothetical protein
LEELLALVVQLQHQVSELQRQVAQLAARNEALQAENAERYHLKGELLRFLEEPLVEPTNNRVERALRPAAIARKVSQCSKNQAGPTLSPSSRACSRPW